MVGLPKVKRDALKKALSERYSALLDQLEGVALLDQHDCAGGKGRFWRNPELVVKVDPLQLSLAVSDFEAILKEIKKLK